MLVGGARWRWLGGLGGPVEGKLWYSNSDVTRGASTHRLWRYERFETCEGETD